MKSKLWRIPACYRDAYEKWFITGIIDILPATSASIPLTWENIVAIADDVDISMVPVWGPVFVVFALFVGDTMVSALRLHRQPQLEPFVFASELPHIGLPPGFHVDIQ